MTKPSLRSGFTTGTCAAAAAKAAAVFFLTGRHPLTCTIHTPKGIVIELMTELTVDDEYRGYSRVQKDAGDDPDVTHGAWVYALVTALKREQWEQLLQLGRGYTDERFPGLYLNGGTGIGVVTKPGLSCPVGRYAMNPVPRTMILEAVSQVREQYKKHQSGEFLEIRLAIPAGVDLAQQTFNPRLGIEGGISILGTSGIVEPMSEPALLATIQLDIRMKVLAGQAKQESGVIILTPGNYGEAFLYERLGIPLGEAVKCSNFIADSLEMLQQEGAGRVLLVGHIGKLIKVTGGVRNTHSRYGDRRMELLARVVCECQAVPSVAATELITAVLQANTTEEVMGMLVTNGMAAVVLNRVAELVKQQAESWLAADGKIQVEVVTFSSAYGILGKTEGAAHLCVQQRW